MSSSEPASTPSLLRTPGDLARTAVSDPSTAPDRLATIAGLHADLRADVAAHPNVYPELLEWITVHGDGHARQAAFARLETMPRRPVLTPPTPARPADAAIRPSGSPAGSAGLTTSNGYLAGYGVRAGAFLIDVGLMLAALLLLRAIAGFFEMVHLGGLGGLISFVGSLAVLAYQPVFDGVFGQTVGKRILHLRVIHADTGLTIGFGRALLRTLVLWSGAWTVLIGCFSPLFDATGRLRGWHDLAANDLVILGDSPTWTDRLEFLKPQPPSAPLPLEAVPVQCGPGAPSFPKTNTMAILALVATFLPTGPLGVVFGHIALAQIRRTGEEGRVMAIVGLVFGYLWIAALVLFVGAFATIIASIATFSTMH